MEKRSTSIPNRVNSCPCKGNAARTPLIPSAANNGPINAVPQALHPTPNIPATNPANPFPKINFIPDVLRSRMYMTTRVIFNPKRKTRTNVAIREKGVKDDPKVVMSEKRNTIFEPALGKMANTDRIEVILFIQIITYKKATDRIIKSGIYFLLVKIPRTDCIR